MKKLLLVSLCFLMLCITQVYAQNRTITGTVTSKDDGLPLPGVSVTVSGTTNGTQTNASGKYSLSVPASAKSLTFSFIGFQAHTSSIGSSGSVNVALIAGTNELNEVVVSAFGVKREARSLGASVGKITNDQISQVSEPDVLKAMQGKVAGVDIRSSQGTPGASTRIQIRGNTSFSGDSQPLIVVDGVPFSNDNVVTSSQVTGGGAYGNGIGNIDPNDIADMQILKGSGAAALYGSRASNGVIIITTKSGSASRSKKGLEVVLKSSASIEQISKLPELQNNFGTGSYGNYSASNGSWGPKFGGDLKVIPAWTQYLNAYPELFPDGTVPYEAHPDNVKSLFKNGSVFENSVSINGGDEKSAVVLTASQLNQNGYMTNQNFKRSNISLGGSTKLANGLNVRGNLSYASSTQLGGNFGETQSGAPSLFSRSLFLGRNWDLSLPYQDKNGNSIIYAGAGQFDNPLWSARYNTNTSGNERFIANMKADYDLTKWANLSYALGVNTYSVNRREVIEISSRAAQGLGSLKLDNYRKQEIESTLLLNLNPKLKGDFSLTGLVGGNFNQRTTTDLINLGNQFIERGYYTLTNTVQKLVLNDSYARRRLFGLFAEATVGYKNYAFITATGRNDWSSTLPVDNRSYFYPAIQGTFVFTDAFGIKSNVLDYGKLRASWSKVGRDTDPYNLLATFVPNSNYLGLPSLGINSTAFDPNLKPEFTKEVELGTELSFFQQRINLDFTYYNKNSSNLIVPVTTPNSTGYSSYVTNIGGINNKGVEVMLTVKPVMTQSLTWAITGALTKNTNTVTSLTTGLTRFPLGYYSYAEAGMPYGYFRGTVAARDDKGNYLIDPKTGLLITATNPTNIGNPNPKYKLGVTNTVTYKGFTFSALLDYTKGGTIYTTTVVNELGRGTAKITDDRETTWVIPGVYGDPNTQQPILVNGNKVPNTIRVPTNDLYFGSSFATNGANEFSMYDGTVYRLREVSIGYNLPKSLIKRSPFGSVRVSLTGRNLWWVAPNLPKGTNFDPETGSFNDGNNQGIELSTAPNTKRYGFNLTVTF
ncbi:MAG: SusC/RagA family TonB-linked outer membrane protein [Bacteroidota bacterium]